MYAIGNQVTRALCAQGTVNGIIRPFVYTLLPIPVTHYVLAEQYVFNILKIT